MEIIISFLSFIVLISIIVFVHELGHYFAALISNIKVLEFSIGFGRVLLQKRIGKDNTLFTLRLLPLGGFVKPFDQKSVSEDEWNLSSDNDKKRSYSNANYGKRIFMVAMGPLSNFILACFILFLNYSVIGIASQEVKIVDITNGIFYDKLSQNEIIKKINEEKINNIQDFYSKMAEYLMSKDLIKIETNKSKYEFDLSKVSLKKHKSLQDIFGIYLQSPPVIVSIHDLTKDFPAMNAGLKDEDIIDEINGKKINDITYVNRFIKNNPEKEIALKIKRNNKIMDVKLTTIKEVDNGKIIGKIGVNFKAKLIKGEKRKIYSIKDAVIKSCSDTYHLVRSSYYSIIRIITGELSLDSLSGPISLATYSGKTLLAGTYVFFNLMAIVSIGIGVFNLFPIPILDGGVICQYILELIWGKKIPESKIQFAQMVGIAVVVSLFSFSVINDLLKILTS